MSPRHLVVGLSILACAPSAHAGSTGQRVAPQLGVAYHAEDVSRTLFLNRCAGGCTFTPGQNDARYNTSSIVNRTALLSEWQHGDAAWDALVACVADVYAPYDVAVTDEDPGDVLFHHEAVVAGSWPEAIETPAGGIAPSQCFPANNVISFTFANDYPASPLDICATVAQETAHSYGLEHVLDCSDPMTYLESCGRQFFRDAGSTCGEYEERACYCGGSLQNSHQWLNSVLGPNSTPVPGPSLTILQPDEGAQVADGFVITLTAEHMRGVVAVDLLINGTLVASQEGHGEAGYDFAAPADLADGILDIEVRARNDLGTESLKMVTVTKGEPCGAPSDCHDGQECDAGRCIWPPPTGELGASCANDGECVSGLCGQGDDGGRCTEECFPSSVDDPCPNGFECVTVAVNQGVCWATKDGGFGCATGGGASAGAWLALLGLLALGRRRDR